MVLTCAAAYLYRKCGVVRIRLREQLIPIESRVDGRREERKDGYWEGSVIIGLA